MAKKKTSKRVGRPALPKAQRRSRKVFFLMTPAEYKNLATAAKRAGRTVSGYVSGIVNETIRKSG